MGSSSCAKVHHPQLTRRKHPQLPNKLSNSNLNFETSVKITVICQDNRMREMFDFEDLENSEVHSIELNSKANVTKFRSGVGFDKYLEGKDEKYLRLEDVENKEQSNNEIGFRFICGNDIESHLDIDKNDKAILCRVGNEGRELSVGDEIHIGKLSMKLIYHMNQDQIKAMKDGFSQGSSRNMCGGSRCDQNSRNKGGSKCDQNSRNKGGQQNKCDAQNLQCRICFEKETDKENPLLRPCKCTGSISSIHRKCLSHWVFHQPTPFQNNKNIFRFAVKNKNCEICKHSYQNYIWSRVTYCLDLYQGLYSIFECKKRTSKENNSIEYILFRFDPIHFSFKIGRSTKCDCVFENSSISKLNCTLIYKNGRLVIRDEKSRFGTGILMNCDRFEIGCSYIMGRTLVKVEGAKIQENVWDFGNKIFKI